MPDAGERMRRRWRVMYIIYRMDKILLFPYWLTLKVRHLLFDNGCRKVYTPEVPSICIGNITVGGTGKTPHTEMLVRTLL